MELRILFLLEACRINAGYTLKQAAPLLDISDRTLSKYEADSSAIPYNLLEKMVILYKVPADYIFLGKKYDFIRKMQKSTAND